MQGPFISFTESNGELFANTLRRQIRNYCSECLRKAKAYGTIAVRKP